MKILLGADPEVFVIRGGKPFSAHGMVPGTKKEPHKVKKGAVQVDGMALEFNIDPANTAKKFSSNVQQVLATLQGMIPEDCRIDVSPSVEFEWDHIKAQPKEALELGCEPDFNAYTAAANPRPNGNTNLRTASGHVHIGWTKDANIQEPKHFQQCCQLAIQLDYFLAVPSLLIDKDTRRRQLYGKAGCFRPKPYGMEYRTLSNFWLKSPDLMEWVFTATTTAIEYLIKGKRMSAMMGHPCMYAINRGGGAMEQYFRYTKVYYPKVHDIYMDLAKDVIEKYGNAK